MKISVRASSLPDWADCSKRAEYKNITHKEPNIAGMPVSTLVGHRAHNLLTGHEFEEPDRIVFDRATPSDREAYRQAQSIRTHAIEKMEEEGLDIKGSEESLSETVRIGDVTIDLTGTLDLRVFDEKLGGTYILDLKTGVNRPRAAILQLAGYAWLAEKNGTDDDLAGAGILWVPRGKTHCEYITWGIDPLMEIAEESLRQIAGYQKNGVYANPNSLGCGNCPLPGLGECKQVRL